MDKYTELMQRIESQYSGEEIEQTENIISLYDLYTILMLEMKPLNMIKMGNDLQNKINADRTIFRRIGLFKRQAVIDKKCTGIYTDIGETRSEIVFSFDERRSSVGSHLTLYKDIDSDELYFGDFSLKDREFVEKYLSDIYDIYAILESYGTLFPYENEKGRQSLNQEFDDGILKVNITCDTYGRVAIQVSPSKGVDSDNLYTRSWLNRQTVSSYVDENIDDILCRIPVEISSLNEVYRTLVEYNLAKKKAMTLKKSYGMDN